MSESNRGPKAKGEKGIRNECGCFQSGSGGSKWESGRSERKMNCCERKQTKEKNNIGEK